MKFQGAFHSRRPFSLGAAFFVLTPACARAARRVCEAVKLPRILTDGVRSLEEVKSMLADGIADFIGFSHLLVTEPNLIKRWQNGDTVRSENGPPWLYSTFYLFFLQLEREGR